MRWGSYATSAAVSTLALVLLLAVAGASLKGSEMDSRVQDIVADDLAPAATADHAGGLASAVYVAGHKLFFIYGLADQAEKRPITPDTLFNIASVRKVFDATLVALG